MTENSAPELPPDADLAVASRLVSQAVLVAHGAGRDVGEFVALATVRAAATLGGVEVLLSNRQGSWVHDGRRGARRRKNQTKAVATSRHHQLPTSVGLGWKPHKAFSDYPTATAPTSRSRTQPMTGSVRDGAFCSPRRR